MEASEKMFLFGIMPLVAGFAFGLSLMHIITQGPCNCTIDFNGTQVSVEDAINLTMEGLSVDQADEVQIMINNSLGR